MVHHYERAALMAPIVPGLHLAAMWRALTASPPDTALLDVDPAQFLDSAKAACFFLSNPATSPAPAAGGAVAAAVPAHEAGWGHGYHQHWGAGWDSWWDAWHGAEEPHAGPSPWQGHGEASSGSQWPQTNRKNWEDWTATTSGLPMFKTGRTYGLQSKQMERHHEFPYRTLSICVSYKNSGHCKFGWGC